MNNHKTLGELNDMLSRAMRVLGLSYRGDSVHYRHVKTGNPYAVREVTVHADTGELMTTYAPVVEMLPSPVREATGGGTAVPEAPPVFTLPLDEFLAKFVRA